MYLAGRQRLDLTDGEPSAFGGYGGFSRAGWTFKGGAATTDAEGRFTVRGVGGSEQKLVVTSASGQMVWPTPKAEAGKELKVTLPQPASLIVRYDIANDEQQAQLHLQLQTGELDAVLWKDVSSALDAKVANGAQITLTDLTPGTYEFFRMKELGIRDSWLGYPYERWTIVIEAGQTQRVDLVRSTGYSIHGEVTGLNDTAAPGAYILVRSAEATGDQLKDGSLPMFDAVTCGKDGRFQTARLEPGNYTVVVEAYSPEKPEIHNDNGRRVQVFRTGVRLPSYVGTARVTVTANAAPPAVKIELHPLGERTKTP